MYIFQFVITQLITQLICMCMSVSSYIHISLYLYPLLFFSENVD